MHTSKNSIQKSTDALHASASRFKNYLKNFWLSLFSALSLLVGSHEATHAQTPGEKIQTIRTELHNFEKNYNLKNKEQITKKILEYKAVLDSLPQRTRDVYAVEISEREKEMAQILKALDNKQVKFIWEKDLGKMGSTVTNYYQEEFEIKAEKEIKMRKEYYRKLEAYNKHEESIRNWTNEEKDVKIRGTKNNTNFAGNIKNDIGLDEITNNKINISKKEYPHQAEENKEIFEKAIARYKAQWLEVDHFTFWNVIDKKILVYRPIFRKPDKPNIAEPELDGMKQQKIKPEKNNEGTFMMLNGKKYTYKKLIEAFPQFKNDSIFKANFPDYKIPK